MEESEGLGGGGLMGTAGMWTAGWRIWAHGAKKRGGAGWPPRRDAARNMGTAAAAVHRNGSERLSLSPSPPRRGSERAKKGRRWPSSRRAAPDDLPKGGGYAQAARSDRKSTRLNSSH